MPPAAGDDAAARVRELLERTVEALGLDARVEVEDDAEVVRGELFGQDLGLFIGRRGQTIDAVQHLAYRAAARGAGEHERRRVVIDAAGYRERRAKMLAHDADRAADQALRYGRPVALDAMNPAERRIVHEHLRGRAGVDTYSEGEEPDRHLVVSPAAP